MRDIAVLPSSHLIGCGAIIVDLFGLAVVSPILPLIVTEVQVGQLITAQYVTNVLGVMLVGLLSDCLGRRTMVVLVMVADAILFAATGLTRAFAALFAIRLGVGLFAPLALGVSYVQECSAGLPPAKLGTNFAHLGASFNIGSLAGALLGGLLGPANWALANILSGVLAAAVGMWALLARSPSEDARRRKAAAAAAAADPAPEASSARVVAVEAEEIEAKEATVGEKLEAATAAATETATEVATKIATEAATVAAATEAAASAAATETPVAVKPSAPAAADPEGAPAAKEPVVVAAPAAAAPTSSQLEALGRLLQTASHSSLLLAFAVQGWFQGAYFSLMPLTVTAVYMRNHAASLQSGVVAYNATALSEVPFSERAAGASSVISAIIVGSSVMQLLTNLCLVKRLQARLGGLLFVVCAQLGLCVLLVAALVTLPGLLGTVDMEGAAAQGVRDGAAPPALFALFCVLFSCAFTWCASTLTTLNQISSSYALRHKAPIGTVNAVGRAVFAIGFAVGPVLSVVLATGVAPWLPMAVMAVLALATSLAHAVLLACGAADPIPHRRKAAK